jgi:hypothetical protein
MPEGNGVLLVYMSFNYVSEVLSLVFPTLELGASTGSFEPLRSVCQFIYVRLLSGMSAGYRMVR